MPTTGGNATASTYYGAPGSSSTMQPGSVGAQTASDRESSPNADIGNTHTQSASGRGSVIGGDASAKTSMGGSSGGGSGSGGSGGGYSLGASIADSTTISTGFSGDARGATGSVGFGDFNPNFGGTQSNGLGGSAIMWLGIAAAAVVGLVVFLWKKGR